MRLPPDKQARGERGWQEGGWGKEVETAATIKITTTVARQMMMLLLFLLLVIEHAAARLGVEKELADVLRATRSAVFLWLIYTLNLCRNFIYKLLPKRQKLRLAADDAAAVD